MTEAKPTPGVWTVIEGINGGWSIMAHLDDDVAGVCDRAPWPHRADESRANARLIAAAPETAAERDRLKALVGELVGNLASAADRLERCIVQNGTDPEFAKDAVAVYRAALAKAKEQE